MKKLASETGNPDIELLVVDLSSQKSIRTAAEKFSGKNSVLDVLVNNAASYSSQRRETAEGIEYTFATNVLGYQLLTECSRIAETSARSPHRQCRFPNGLRPRHHGRELQPQALQRVCGIRAEQAGQSNADLGAGAAARRDIGYGECVASGASGYAAA